MQTFTLTCRHCTVTTFYTNASIERDHSEWIIHCAECGAKNILAITIIGTVPVPRLEAVAWRE